MRVLLTADLQLGSGQPLGNGEYGPGSRFSDQQAMLARIDYICHDEDVDVVCILGDVFDRSRPAPHEILAFQAFVRGLISDKQKVFCLTGNHDVRSAALPSALEIFAGDGCVVALQPSLYPIGDIVLAALPWTPPSRMVAHHPGASRDELNDLAAQALVEGAHIMSARCREEHPDKTAILVGHWAVSGASLPTGLDVALLREPVIPLEGLTSSGFALAMFGHIHLAGMLATDGTPVGYTGAPWVNSWGETEGEHGVWIFDSDAGKLDFHPVTDPKRFVTLEPDFVEASIFGTAIPQYVMTLKTAAPPLEGALVRVKYTVTEEVARGIDQAALRQSLLSQGAVKVFLKPTVTRAVRARAQAMTDELGAVAALDLWISSQDVEANAAAEMRLAHAGYLAKVR